MVLLSRGLTYKQMALELDIELSTVRTHAHHAYGKIGAHNSAHAVSILMQCRGEIPLKPLNRPTPYQPPSSYADTAPLLHAYLQLWENAGAPVPRLADLNHDEIPDLERRAMRALLSMHVQLTRRSGSSEPTS